MKILFISLGCDKNLVDSEHMLGMLCENGYTVTDDEYEADVIVVNTCCFINDAKEESIENIIEMAKLKSEGKLKVLIVTGCLAQRYKEEIQKEIPEVDAVIGTTAYDDIVEVLDGILNSNNKETNNSFKDINYLTKNGKKRVLTTGGYTSYLKIAEGCNKNCTYCIIPKLRGKFRSVPMEELLEEAKNLADQGIKELILVAQETTLYGVDIYGEKRLPQLLKELCKIEGFEWIRILYTYPEEITDELIQVIKEEDKICKYIDMPIQHASDAILRKMGRRTNRQDLVNIITKLRNEIEDIVIRTTLITGFPGETEEDFETLLDFVYDMSFERLGVFAYSPEEGTRAADMENQVEDQIKEARKNAIMEMQQDITFDYMASLKGNIMKVIIEGYIVDDDIYVGRTYMDAPNIDGLVFVNSDRNHMSGDIIIAEITASEGYDLIATEIV
ncbi:MAG: 30S ribosomal protein S12 methylthiotransferase RimO [Lachnospiraceae bacterium]|nr:30S ribosomal protein S12 methylthiotransferase RimO [Lachnospiraceae bacterium]